MSDDMTEEQWAAWEQAVRAAAARISAAWEVAQDRLYGQPSNAVDPRGP